MFELYYSIWKDAWKIVPRRSFWREVFPEFTWLLKLLMILFLIFGTTTITLLAFATYNAALYAATMIVAAIFFLDTFFLTIVFDRYYLDPVNRRYEMRRDFAIQLYGKFVQKGIESSSQVLALREEALRIIQQKAHSREVVINRVIDVAVIGFLFWSLTSIMSGVDKGLGIETAVSLALFAVVLAFVAAVISRPLWDRIDSFKMMPQAKLQAYSDCLLVMYIELLRSESFSSVKEQGKLFVSANNFTRNKQNASTGSRNLSRRHSCSKCRKRSSK